MDDSRSRLFEGPQPELTDGVVRLRPLAERDIDAVLGYATESDVARWTTIPVPYGRADAEVFVRETSHTWWASRRGAEWAFTGVNDDILAGTIALRGYTDDPEVANVGFIAAPWARGRGWTTAALRLACAWGLDVFGLARIEWHAVVGNHASRRVAEKVGFVMEGTLRAGMAHRGQRRDSWLASLLPSDPRPATTASGRQSERLITP